MERLLTTQENFIHSRWKTFKNNIFSIVDRLNGIIRNLISYGTSNNTKLNWYTSILSTRFFKPLFLGFQEKGHETNDARNPQKNGSSYSKAVEVYILGIMFHVKHFLKIIPIFILFSLTTYCLWNYSKCSVCMNTKDKLNQQGKNIHQDVDHALVNLCMLDKLSKCLFRINVLNLRKKKFMNHNKFEILKLSVDCIIEKKLEKRRLECPVKIYFLQKGYKSASDSNWNLLKLLTREHGNEVGILQVIVFLKITWKDSDAVKEFVGSPRNNFISSYLPPHNFKACGPDGIPMEFFKVFDSLVKKNDSEESTHNQIAFGMAHLQHSYSIIFIVVTHYLYPKYKQSSIFYEYTSLLLMSYNWIFRGKKRRHFGETLLYIPKSAGILPIWLRNNTISILVPLTESTESNFLNENLSGLVVVTIIYFKDVTSLSYYFRIK
ncbi:hypothetical protein H8356DRAFT_1358389 [Neocallimastix lanati (nom. inval.)]|nr:hypothetical protein H8356DRAFT_1358389 [Neocallimastix sp. JGI-2020a]